MLPLVAKEIVSNPRGATAQMVKVGSKSDRSSDKPGWMKGETSIPLNEQHIAGLGLMHEDSARLLGAMAKGDIHELAKQGAARLNPLLKFPIEQASQHDMRTGKAINKIHDVEDIAGLPIGTAAEHLLRSSPVARYITEAKQSQKAKDGKALLLRAAGIKSGN